MSLTQRLLAHFRRIAGGPTGAVQTEPCGIECAVLMRAQGDWLALLATILEREGVIAGEELARLLAEFAVVTSVNRPAEGRILAAWASNLQGAAESLRDLPSLH